MPKGESDIAIRSKEIMNDFLNLTGMTVINISIDEYCSIREQAAKELSHCAIYQQEKTVNAATFSAVPFSESKSDELRQATLDIKPVVENMVKEETNCQSIQRKTTPVLERGAEEINSSVTTNSSIEETDNRIPQNKEELSDRKKRELEILNRIPEN